MLAVKRFWNPSKAPRHRGWLDVLWVPAGPESCLRGHWWPAWCFPRGQGRVWPWGGVLPAHPGSGNCCYSLCSRLGLEWCWMRSFFYSQTGWKCEPGHPAASNMHVCCYRKAWKGVLLTADVEEMRENLKNAICCIADCISCEWRNLGGIKLIIKKSDIWGNFSTGSGTWPEPVLKLYHCWPQWAKGGRSLLASTGWSSDATGKNDIKAKHYY